METFQYQKIRFSIIGYEDSSTGQVLPLLVMNIFPMKIFQYLLRRTSRTYYEYLPVPVMKTSIGYEDLPIPATSTFKYWLWETQYRLWSPTSTDYGGHPIPVMKTIQYQLWRPSSTGYEDLLVSYYNHILVMKTFHYRFRRLSSTSHKDLPALFMKTF